VYRPAARCWAVCPNVARVLEKQGGKLGKVVEYTSYPEAYQDLALAGRLRGQHRQSICKRWLPKNPSSRLVRLFRDNRTPAWAVAEITRSCWPFLNDLIARKRRAAGFAELQKKWFGEAAFPNLPVAFEPDF